MAFFIGILGLGACFAVSWASPTPRNSSCRALPGDAAWPSVQEWSTLNSTVNGKLIATVPLASPCHDPNYDKAACVALRQNWIWPQTHEVSPSSIMQPYFQNASCDPFTPRSTPCELGNYAAYSINVSTAQDVVAGLSFARQKNLRLVIKNTGHDYNGKSTGTGALSLWTHNLKGSKFLNYSSEYYTGPAFQFAAGTLGLEAYEAAHAYGKRVVGGDCPTVGIVGGYTQGGGHSSLSSIYGLGADQTLAWEVITADGRQVVATPTQNSDLYWALSGGGPGTYGVVLSMTVRAYEDGPIGGASLVIPSTGIPNDTYWDLFASWQSGLPNLTDAGATAAYAISQESFFLQPLTAPGYTTDQVRSLLAPFTTQLDRRNVSYSLNVTSEPSFLDHYARYLGPLPNGPYNINQLFGGTLIPRAVIETNNAVMVQALRNITEHTSAFLGFVSVNVAKSRHAAAIPNAVLPQWRDATVSVLAQQIYDFTLASPARLAAAQRQLQEEVVPQLKAAAGADSGTYLNEANFADVTYKSDFYGANYDRLRSIKAKWDPDDFFYAQTGVGSDAWVVAADGRLCRSGAR